MKMFLFIALSIVLSVLSAVTSHKVNHLIMVCLFNRQPLCQVIFIKALSYPYFWLYEQQTGRSPAKEPPMPEKKRKILEDIQISEGDSASDPNSGRQGNGKPNSKRSSASPKKGPVQTRTEKPEIQPATNSKPVEQQPNPVAGNAIPPSLPPAESIIRSEDSPVSAGFVIALISLALAGLVGVFIIGKKLVQLIRQR